MTKEQIQAIRCAFADLCGSLQAFHQSDIHVHDWRGHQQSLEDLMEAFPELELELPDNLKDGEDD